MFFNNSKDFVCNSDIVTKAKENCLVPVTSPLWFCYCHFVPFQFCFSKSGQNLVDIGWFRVKGAHFVAPSKYWFFPIPCPPALKSQYRKLCRCVKQRILSLLRALNLYGWSLVLQDRNTWLCINVSSKSSPAPPFTRPTFPVAKPHLSCGKASHTNSQLELTVTGNIDVSVMLWQCCAMLCKVL